MKKLILFFCGVLLFPIISPAQCPSSAFSISGSACAGQVVNFTNTSTGAVSYKWDFCSGDFDSIATISTYDTLGTPGLNTPAGSTPVIDGTDHYAFICNRSGNSIFRVDFGNSFNNTPSDITNLGNPLGFLNGPNGIVFIKETGIWYALVNNYSSNQVIKLDFGAGIANAPTNAAAIVSINFSTPRGIDIVKDTAGYIYAAVANFGSNSITMLSFGNSINNAVTVSAPISIPSCALPMDVSLAHECANWYAFVCSYGSSGVYRVDFGNSLQNTPVNFPQIISAASPLSGISVVNENAKWVVCTMGYGNGYMYTYSIGDFLSDTNATLLGSNFLINQNPVGIKLIKENSDWNGFTTIESVNGFEKISFINSCNVNNSTSSSFNPANLIYNTGGTYNVTLQAIDSTGNVSYFSDTIHVNYSPSPSFSFQNTCFNDTTAFKDSSSFPQGTITGRQWDFGDSTHDVALNPTHIYASPGKYVVSLSLSGNNGCNNVFTDTVIIGDIPSANFSDSAGCSNLPVTFNDLSTVGFSNNIVNWHWDFGDGDTSSVQNPVYEYPVGGTYPVTLTVTTNYNCSSTPYQENINVNDAPKAGFVVANTCVDSTVIFTDISIVHSGSINAWQWNFGDADTSTLQSPSHLYTASVGAYNVSLIASAANGCSDTATLAVKVNNVPVSAFSFAPATICEGNAIILSDQSTVAGDTIYAWHWDFGDSTISTSKNPSHTYSTSGTYTIVLTVYSQTSCSASSTQTVTVAKSPTAGFISALTCFGDSSYFADTSIPSTGAMITEWHWDFGDGDTSNLANTNYHYDSAGTYSVSLTVTDNIGCANTFDTSFAVHHLPVSAFTGSTGCTSTPFQFIDMSTSTDSTISSYLWNFGDPSGGSGDTSTNTSPSHIYYNAGSDTVSLIVTTVFGCSDTAYSIATINQSSAANFNYMPTCEKEQTIFTNHDSIQGIDSLWVWQFGDGGESFLPSPSHYYFNPGTYYVTLSVTSMGGCVTTITKPVVVSPNPVADFVNAPACINSPYSFQDISTITSGSINAWHWDFGNGDTSDVQFPNETYTDTGDYIVSLTVSTAIGCTGSVTNTIHVYPLPVANFSYNPPYGSPPLSVNFTDLSNGAALYLWTFGDGDSSASSSPSHTYQDTGKFTITQIVYSAQGCVDSMSKVIYVIKPILDIAVTNVSYQLLNNQFKVSAQVENLGTLDIANYTMQASIQDGATIAEDVSTPLPSGPQGIIVYHFTAAFEISPEQNINYYCVSALNPNGVTDDNPANNEKCATLTNNFTVVQPFPNPFNNQLQLQFILPFKDQITAELFDNIGQKISTLYDNVADAGETTLQVSTAALENEIYFCHFTFRGQTLVFPIVKMTEKK